ncbi:MAG: hypothetical protein WC651_02250 [Candidatus Gracilibacteria bacterium]|jgi:uncharacterized lipoprotein
MLVLTQYIAKHEFKPLQRFLGINDLSKGAEKVLKGLVPEIRPPQKIPSFKFFKVRIGKDNNSRMIVFVATENRKVVPVLIRLKKDKIFGMNMAMNTPKVVDQINKNLDHVLEDIEEERYQEFPS